MNVLLRSVHVLWPGAMVVLSLLVANTSFNVREFLQVRKCQRKFFRVASTFEKIYKSNFKKMYFYSMSKNIEMYRSSFEKIDPFLQISGSFSTLLLVFQQQ